MSKRRSHDGEEHDLSVGRGLGRLVPAHMHTATHRVDHHRLLAGLRQRGLLRFVGFTHRVSLPNSINPAPALKKTAMVQGQLRFLGSVQSQGNTVAEGMCSQHGAHVAAPR